ncbi:catalase family protein [uncultured Microbulbifer sp.]|uniref:catalase family protein n=1 Tax=uncultured Microbulbifer sp. TaxID=348147 RepID=UPI0025FAABBA|nr:catalase family protein [uncultured Microbulbifer sp.]
MKTLPCALAAAMIAPLLTFSPMLRASDQAAAPASELDDLGMNISLEEKVAILSAINSAREVSRIAQAHNGETFRRDAHAKATGCVRARFTVNADIPDEFRHSLFAEPGREYQAWIRFSNGDMLVQPDATPDARGMAIKVMGAEGAPVAPELGASGSQDFIMTNTPAFFNRNIHDYAENMQHLARLDKTGWFVSLWPPRLHLRETIRARQTVSSRIDTPLAAQYFSMLPYRLGNTPLKFSARPCPGSRYEVTVDQSGDDFLTRQMADTLETGAACFDFMVQPQTDETAMPLDDATEIWPESQSPFQSIARVRIPPQTFTGSAQQTFCENLSMNPWNGVGEWEPLGSLSRARRLVYKAVSDYRHSQNNAPLAAPVNWCVPGYPEPCSTTQGLNVRKPRWPLPRCFDPQFRPVDGSVVDSQCEDGNYGSAAAY